MTQEEKQLLLQDICARLSYGVKATTTSNGWRDVYTVTGYNDDRIYLDCPVYDEGDDEWLIESVKPYLRSMESMTVEEICKIQNFIGEEFKYKDETLTLNSENVIRIPIYKMSNLLQFMYQRHLDFNNLISMGLDIEATEDMYDIK